MNQRILSLFAVLSVLPAGTVTSAPLVELFTSQGCYSCPPADDHLAELIEKKDVVALEYHVDYWDDLNYGSAGIWKDPFSSPAYTKRQRLYNSYRLKGNRGVYTPQMVMDGTQAEVGSQRRAVRNAIDDLGVQPLTISAQANSSQKVEVKLSGEYTAKAVVWLAVFDREQVTDVIRGENHGKVMRNHHVVRELTPIADWQNGGGSTSIEVPALSDSNAGCAIFVQDYANGKILGAEYCT